MKLTSEQIEQFKNTGYLVVCNLYDTATMKIISEWTNDVASYPEVPGKCMMYFEASKLEPGRRILCRVEDIEPYHKGFSELFTSSEIQQVSSQLFAEEAVLFKDKINFKMPGGDGFKAHQDAQAGWDRYAKLHITAMVSIYAATAENGYLEIASAHNSKGLIGEQWKPLQEDELYYEPVPANPGDAVFFCSYTPHRSGPNLSDKKRRVLYATYNAAAAGDHRRRYYHDKRLSYPPDIEREPDKEYVFRV